MAAPKVMSGARAKIGFVSNGQAVYCGIYNNFSYGVVYDMAPAFILGRWSAASLDYTAVEPVQCSANAYRVFHFGPHVNAVGGAGGGHVPRLNALLTFDDLTVAVYDRANGNTAIATINSVKPGGYNTGLTARQLEEISMNYTGLLVDDEDGPNSEPADSSFLPG